MLEKAKILKKRYGKNLKTPFLQELIWFHRITEDQDKELLTLEFLNVCASHVKENKLFAKEDFALYKRDIQIRNILYNFFELEEIIKSPRDEDEKWEEINLTLSSKFEKPFKYLHLKNNFQSTEVFFTAITLLKRASLGMNTNRRWSSKFLFPFSFDTLFVDMDNRASSIDRRFFSRGGEVLYLMVSRAKNAHKLKTLMLNIYEKPKQNERWSKLLSLLRNDYDIEKKFEPTQLGFLSLDSHPLFEQLVDDLINLMQSNITINDIFEHFSSIASFYMIHFILTIAIEITREKSSERVLYPIEILAPRSDHVRKSSRLIYKINENLPMEALKVKFEKYIQPLKDIKDKDTLFQKLNLEINYHKDEEDEDREEFDFEELKKKIWEKITLKAKREIIPIHRSLLKGVGLASMAKTNAYRYLISDEFLKTLVLINVDSRLIFSDFIELLYSKYGFVISNKHSILLNDKYSENDFKKNENRLFQRLSALGLLENKSDGYAYVINSYGRVK